MSVNVVRNFVESFFEGDPEVALAKIADVYGIAILTQGITEFTQMIRTPYLPLTSHEWELIAAENRESLGEVLDPTGDVLAEYRYDVLKRAGFTSNGDGSWTSPGDLQDG